MKFAVSREVLLKPLQHVAGVVERKQTMPVLANVLAVLDNSVLSITGTDMEVELVAKIPVAQEVGGEITIPAKKLFEITKSIPESSEIKFALDDQKIVIRAGRSRFSLATLPANDFPNLDEDIEAKRFQVSQKKLKHLIDRTAFAMALQDVRYYLNGLLVEADAGRLRCVATDGHRMSLCECELISSEINQKTQVILPRKGVLELSRLLEPVDDPVTVVIGGNHLKVEIGDVFFTTKLLDGKFPSYERVLPKGGEVSFVVNREEVRNALNRVSILSNEKYRSVRIRLEEGSMGVIANNPEQEEAEESVTVDYTGDSIDVGFNVSYLLDVMTVTKDESLRITLADTNRSALLEELNSDDCKYVVMPMKL